MGRVVIGVLLAALLAAASGARGERRRRRAAGRDDRLAMGPALHRLRRRAGAQAGGRDRLGPDRHARLPDRRRLVPGPYRSDETALISLFVPPAGFHPRDDATYFPMPWLLSTRGSADVVRRLSARIGRQPAPGAPFYFGPWYQPRRGDEAAERDTLLAQDVPSSVAQTCAKTTRVLTARFRGTRGRLVVSGRCQAGS